MPVFDNQTENMALLRGYLATHRRLKLTASRTERINAINFDLNGSGMRMVQLDQPYQIEEGEGYLVHLNQGRLMISTAKGLDPLEEAAKPEHLWE